MPSSIPLCILDPGLVRRACCIVYARRHSQHPLTISTRRTGNRTYPFRTTSLAPTDPCSLSNFQVRKRFPSSFLLSSQNPLTHSLTHNFPTSFPTPTL
ncbi:hypothetical protein BDZ94DRAFT_1277382 [Collybia nuda]|uniref:Uncharacterized protein n=1 Tax=Collybia nuda TaxID=64659 RepID=A0A9P6CB64_9AGAR|nr:hypothetical protein BDZ94DRAFT_1277382 [Collybia nuda]